MDTKKLIVIPDDYQFGGRKISCLHNDPNYEVVSLGDVNSDANSTELLKNADGLILIRERTKIDDDFLEKVPNLKVISQTGKIARNIDLNLCKVKGIDVLEGNGLLTAPAELTWLLIQSSIRQFIPSLNGLNAGKWQVAVGDTVEGKTLGILGYGNIAKRVIKYAQAFGMNVKVWGSDRALAEAQKNGIEIPISRADFFSSCDVISIHQRLLPNTRGNITFEDLSLMKRTSLFVNTARAELVEKNALEKALDNGKPGFAALDVFFEEPIWNSEHPLLKRPNVLCSPHLGYVAQSSYEIYFCSAFDNIKKYFSGDQSPVI